jgi:hypothetical protein
MATSDRGASGEVQTLVCLTCGNYLFFESDVPSSLKCDKCGGTVFRPFTTPNPSDEVADSRLEETEREMALGDPSPATTPDDLRELNEP